MKPQPIILLIDDNLTNQKLVTHVLESDGYSIIIANDAEEAQAIVATTTPDLILMDIALPGMDGLTFTRQLKADPKTRGIQIVAISAYAMKGDDAKAMEAGCQGYITKPINTRTFSAEIAAYLNPSREKPAGEPTTGS